MSRAVQEMFSSIAKGYDRANTVLSLGVHHLWRRAARRLLALRPGERVLDVCTGTGDVAFALLKAGPTGLRVVGTDFCEPMLHLARRKAERRGQCVHLLAADALRLPFRDACFDVATIAFGIRNLDDPVAGLGEMRRVLRPGGRLLVLEFGQPRGALFAPAYRLYSCRILPLLGHLVTGKRSAYEYLHRTSSAFPSGEAFLALMRQAGLGPVRAVPLTFGIAYAYRGEVPAPGGGHASGV
jgi:demethylmenaquinone methyltransferase/2-methoxy-6-polyprenyl-1,4-benzoquinol methylase